MKESILIATSLAPGKRINIQRQAVGTWLDQGFSVISLNCAEEISLLQKTFHNIQFVMASRSASLMTGKPLVYLSDIIHYLQTEGTEVCGIVNSDIFFPSSVDVPAMIGATAKNTLLLGQRVDVINFDDTDGKREHFGFDYFFFDRTILDNFRGAEFCLGMPMWDFWFPLVLIDAGVPSKRLEPPLGRHLAHETAWGDKIFLFGGIFLRYLTRILARNPKEASLADNFLDYHHDRLLNSAKRMRQKGAKLTEQDYYVRMSQLAELYDSLAQFSFELIMERSEKFFWC